MYAAFRCLIPKSYGCYLFVSIAAFRFCLGVMILKTLYDVASNPSGLDSFSNYAGEIPSKSLLVVLVRFRDSDILTESNWEVALDRLGGESETVEIHRFGHWACGWWEALTVSKGSEAHKEGQEIADEIEVYPVLNEDHFSEMEGDEAHRVWSECYDAKERIEYLRESSGWDFRSIGDLLQCVRGNFAPFTSEGYSGVLGC